MGSYNHKLLKQTRVKKGISLLDIANQLCLAERQIFSIEENSSEYFPSPTLKLVCVRKYAKLLDLNLSEVMLHCESIGDF
jgi:cytoskeletal protein RodZ